jgi:carbamate kinase
MGLLTKYLVEEKDEAFSNPKEPVLIGNPL